ncbi:MAG TPA: PhoH family protein, partial [Nitrospirota bacterium]|nr:PhoH family protein [Nitrospirota bacterium]
DNDVVIPIVVIEELDKFKKGMDEIGRNARQVSRHLDELRLKNKLSIGVDLDSGGTLRVELNHQHDIPCPLPYDMSVSIADNRILMVALCLTKEKPGESVILVTKDTNLRIKADAVGVKTEDYETGTVDITELYSGEAEMEASREEIDRLFEEHGLPVDGQGRAFYPNQFVLLKDSANPAHTALSKFVQKKKALVQLIGARQGVWGVTSRNKEQSYALDLLLDDDIKLVTLVGKAGTGKTLLALAAGLEKTVEERVFSRLVVSRPIFPLGRDLGFLPGDVEEKLKPWMQPIFDNLEYLMGPPEGRGRRPKDYHGLVDLGMLELEPLTYIRGRSMPNRYLIVDEAQNLTPHEIKTIITRAGEGTKIVLTGDPYQIDNPYIDSASNGLTYVAERFKEEPIAGHITLKKGERSRLAELAAQLL